MILLFWIGSSPIGKRAAPSTVSGAWCWSVPLNERIERLGLRYARRSSWRASCAIATVMSSTSPSFHSGELYGDDMRGWFAHRGVEIRENAAVREVAIGETGVTHLLLRDGSTLVADWYVLAVPFERVLDLLPEELVEREPYFGNIRNLTPSPITSIHLWFDRKVMKRPHAVIVDGLGQWVFNRGEVAPGEFYLQIVISASGELRAWGARK